MATGASHGSVGREASSGAWRGLPEESSLRLGGVRHLVDALAVLVLSAPKQRSNARGGSGPRVRGRGEDLRTNRRVVRLFESGRMALGRLDRVSDGARADPCSTRSFGRLGCESGFARTERVSGGTKSAIEEASGDGGARAPGPGGHRTPSSCPTGATARPEPAPLVPWRGVPEVPEEGGGHGVWFLPGDGQGISVASEINPGHVQSKSRFRRP